MGSAAGRRASTFYQMCNSGWRKLENPLLGLTLVDLPLPSTHTLLLVVAGVRYVIIILIPHWRYPQAADHHQFCWATTSSTVVSVFLSVHGRSSSLIVNKTGGKYARIFSSSSFVVLVLGQN